MKVHDLKTDPEVFNESWFGIKNYEIRFNDRGFEIGDGLILRETKNSGEEMLLDGAKLEYTGRIIYSEILSILTGYGLMPGWCILGVEHESKNYNKD